MKQLVSILRVTFLSLAISLAMFSGAAPAGAQAPACSDGVDNDGDGKIDTLVAPDPTTATPRVWTRDPFGIVGFVNSKAAEVGFKPVGVDAALNFDLTTAQFVCRLAGYSHVASMDCVSNYDGGRCGWHSPHDNWLDRWDPARQNLTTWRADEAGNRWLSSLTCAHKIPACSDGKDNDGDGQIDFPADSGCANAWDESETPHDPGCTGPNDPNEAEQCRDNIDNDGDIVRDAQDPGCWTNPNNPATYDPNRDDESSATTQCQDGLDNDGDATADFPGDFSCSSKTDNDETNPKSQCQDGLDNDGDGRVDLNDPGCSGRQDNDEFNEVPQCQDGIDNDGDGATDFPNDFSCDSPTDGNETSPKAACQDGFDNDGDGLIDLQDPGCTSKQDNSEENSPPQCQDGIDNDGDGAADFPADFSCTSATDNDETNPKAQCQDGTDNDGDGLIDLADPGCSSKQDNSEFNTLAQCQDGLDNDGDGAIDFPADFSCTSPTDNTEDIQKASCQDGIDNDGDGAIDFPADFSCSSLQDNDEANPKAQCQDGADNDGDGLIDLQDPGCSSRQDNSENNGTSQCQDGIDNDNDGAVDFPNDFGCTSPTDNDEGNPKAQCQDGIDNDGDGQVDFPQDSGCTSKQDNSELNEVSSVLPYLECVYDNGDGSYTAYFGYLNNNTTVVTITAGANTASEVNRFTTGAAVRGQPSTFLPGRHYAVFRVDFDGNSIQWQVKPAGFPHVGSITASSSSHACGAVTPILECVQEEGAGLFSAKFGYQNINPFPLTFPLGARNNFSPAPQNRGQPTVFQAGRSVNAFQTTFTEPSILWTLGNSAAGASQSSPRCGSNTAPVCHAGAPVNMQCQGAETKVFLDGSQSSDPQGTVLTYEWSTNCANATLNNKFGAQPILTLTGPGAGVTANCSVSLTVSDGIYTSSCSTPVHVSACSSCGSGSVDQCGVCNGNNSCLDCAGVPFGNSKIDKCGVCGGSDACVDCTGTVNGLSKLDECGVCNGNGLSCYNCIQSDTTGLLITLDNNAKAQSVLVEKSTKKLLSFTNGSASAVRISKKSIKQAQDLYKANWSTTWSLPKSILNCNAKPAACVQADSQSTLLKYRENAEKLRKVALKLARAFNAAGSERAKKYQVKLTRKATSLYDMAIRNVGQVPRFNTSCN